MSQEQNTDGEIKFIAPLIHEPVTMPSDESMGIWRDLFRAKNECTNCENPLTKEEQDLYDVLTKNLTMHFSFLGIHQSTIETES
jgi:hypothetical protein